MKDTPPVIERKFRQMLMKRSGEERLKMGCSMHATAQALAKASISQQRPALARPSSSGYSFFTFTARTLSPRSETESHRPWQSAVERIVRAKPSSQTLGSWGLRMPSEKAWGGMEKWLKRKANVLGNMTGEANPYEWNGWDRPPSPKGLKTELVTAAIRRFGGNSHSTPQGRVENRLSVS